MIDIKERVTTFALYIIEHRVTIREAASHFGVAKSTVHKDVSVRLMNFNPFLYNRTQEVLRANKAEWHIRGGIATYNKYVRLRG